MAKNPLAICSFSLEYNTQHTQRMRRKVNCSWQILQPVGGVEELVVGGGVTPGVVRGGGACRWPGSRVAIEHLLHTLLEPEEKVQVVWVRLYSSHVPTQCTYIACDFMYYMYIPLKEGLLGIQEILKSIKKTKVNSCYWHIL